MPNLVEHKGAHTYGVLDQSMIERRDTKYVASSLSDALNVIMKPQGGYRDRGGSELASGIRKTISAFVVTAGMITGPNGGTVANLVDGDEATTFVTAAVAGDPFTVFEVDFGSSQNVAAVDVHAFLAATAAADNVVAVQYHNGTSWVALGTPVNLRLSARSRRFAVDPDVSSVATQMIRLVITGGAGPGAITVGELKVWLDAGALVQPRHFKFNRTVSEKFQLVVTENNVDVFKDGVWKAAAYLPVTSAMLARLKPEKDDDGLTFWHQDLEPQIVQWQGADDEWGVRPVVFENMPRYDFGDTEYTNGITEIQEITFYSISDGQTFELELEGEKTSAINYTGVEADNEANIKAGLEALSTVDAGITVSRTTGTTYAVTFSGGENANRDWGQMSGLVHTTGGVITVRTDTKGKKGGEDPISATRGWPAVGRFVAGRLLMVGLKGVPNGYLASVAGDVFNLNIELQGAAAAMFYLIRDEDLGEIWDARVGQSLLLFTDTAVWWLSQEDFSAEQEPLFLRSDAPGIEPHLPPLSLDNSIFYIQRGGEVLRQLTFSELEKNFLGENASVLSSFLISQPRSWALRRATKDNDADLIVIADDAGRMVTITLMRAQEVSGFAPHATVGDYVSFQDDADNDVWQVCKRAMGGVECYALEKMQPDWYVDAAVSGVLGSPGKVISGLERFEGDTLYVWADDHYAGSGVVSGGSLTLDIVYDIETYQAGYWVPPMAKDTPFHLDEETRRPQARLIRVYETEVSLLETTSVALQVNGGVVFDVSFEVHDETLLDVPRGLRPFTGRVTHEGWPGFTETGEVVITQAYPGRLQVRQLKKGLVA